MRQRRAAVSRRNHGNHHLIDVHLKFVLMFGGKMMKHKDDPQYLKCGFAHIEDKKGQKPHLKGRFFFFFFFYVQV